MEETRQAIIAGLKTLRPDVKAEVFEKVRLVQLHELYFSPEFQSMFRGNRATVYSLLTIAILIVVIAMINFINFSVALVPLRIRNINTQKVLGRPTPALRCDTVLEAAGTALISFLLAIPLIQWFAASPLAGITPNQSFPGTKSAPAALTGTMALSAGVIAGLYPAWYSTSFPPALVLKGAFGLSPKGRRIRTGLIAFQYFISIVLIIAAISIQAQKQVPEKLRRGVFPGQHPSRSDLRRHCGTIPLLRRPAEKQSCHPRRNVHRPPTCRERRFFLGIFVPRAPDPVQCRHGIA